MLVLALIAVMTGLGLVASVVSARGCRRWGMAVLVWFVAVFFFDLVLIGMVSATSLGDGGLMLALLANPVEIVRVLAIIQLEPDLEVLGPFGSTCLMSGGWRAPPDCWRWRWWPGRSCRLASRPPVERRDS